MNPIFLMLFIIKCKHNSIQIKPKQNLSESLIEFKKY